MAPSQTDITIKALTHYRVELVKLSRKIREIRKGPIHPDAENTIQELLDQANAAIADLTFLQAVEDGALFND